MSKLEKAKQIFFPLDKIELQGDISLNKVLEEMFVFFILWG